MSDKEWYYYQNGESRGPVSFAELQGLLAGGLITANDLVCKAGMSNWVAAGQVEGLAQPAAAPPPPVAAPPAAAPAVAAPAVAAPAGPGMGERLQQIAESRDLVETMPHLRMVQRFLEMLQRVFSENLLNTVDRWAKPIGSIGLLVAACFLMLGLIVLGIRANAATFLLGGIIGVPLVTVLVHFIAAKFLDAGGPLLRESPSAFSSPAFLHCFALASFLGAVFSVLAGLFSLIQGSFAVAIPGLVLAFVYLYAGGVALNPSVVNVEVGQRASAGQEAIGILMFMFKLLLRLVPFVFGVGMVAAFLGTGYLFIRTIASEPFFAMMMLPAFGPGLIAVALFPIIAYLLFLFLYLVVDVLRAILVVPGKLDALREK